MQTESTPTPLWRPEHSLLLAQAACLSLGTGLVLWGLAPAVIERIVTGHTPPLAMLAMNALIFLLGSAFLLSSFMIHARRRWAAWFAFGLAVMLGGAGVAIILATGMRSSSSFLLLISAVTSFSTWLAIDALGTLNRGRKPRGGYSFHADASEQPG